MQVNDGPTNTSQSFQRSSRGDVVDFIINAVFNFFSEVRKEFGGTRLSAATFSPKGVGYGVLLATGTLVFLGCMSTVTGLGQPEDLTGIALSFACAIIAAVEIGIHLSGGHVNPILTMTAVVFNKISIPMYFVYVFGQLCGSALGYGLVVALNPSSKTNVWKKNGACITKPNPEISVVQALFTEFVVSSILVLVFCAQLDPRNETANTISIKLGLAVYACAYASAVYTGGSLNPARSLGPAIWNNTWDEHWIYWVGPMSASVIWSLLYFKVFVELWPKKKEDEE